MRLGTQCGDYFELSIVGYQFPDAEDPDQHYSWHNVEGTAQAGAERWDFGWPALTCDESGRLVAWLRDAANSAARGATERTVGPARASFTEPNLAFELEHHSSDDTVVNIELDQEFRAPSNSRSHGAGRPTVLRISTTTDELMRAATELAAEVSRYPDRVDDRA